MRLPPFGRGQRIGLFGGSFNPAHRGHYMVALYALKRLQLDWVWWLVSPQNPLKDPKETDDYGKRLAYTRRIARHPRFIVSDLEEQIQHRATPHRRWRRSREPSRAGILSGSWALTVWPTCTAGITGPTSWRACRWRFLPAPAIRSGRCKVRRPRVSPAAGCRSILRHRCRCANRLPSALSPCRYEKKVRLPFGKGASVLERTPLGV